MPFRTNSLRNILPAFTLLLAAVTFASASTISGVVTNRTTGKPAAGDDVVLLQLAQGMQEAGQTTTDARGHFTLQVPDNGMHMLRVTHDKANYFDPIEPGTKTADIDVYTAAAKVPGVTSEAEVMHIESDPGGSALQVVESFFLKNASKPPKTQFSDHAFEFYLPAGAVVEGSIALGPGKMAMPVKSPPVPLGDPDHYAFIFPLRPCANEAQSTLDNHCGETRFQVTYKLPYTGSLTFSPKVSMSTDTLAILVPKSMGFQPSAAGSYTPAADEMNAEAYVARNVQPSTALPFTVSGTGQLPRDTQADGGAQAGSGDTTTAGSSSAQAQNGPEADSRPGGGMATPIDPKGNEEPWSKYRWWILGVLGLCLAAGAGVMLRNGPETVTADVLPAAGLPGAAPMVAVGQAAAATGPGPLLNALKDELFELETDRLAGRLDEAQYAQQKAALEVVLRRALARVEGASRNV